MKISIDQTQAEATRLAKKITGGEVIALIGPLGSGKTTFTQHFAKALGITAQVTSPTFVIMQEYEIPGQEQKPHWLYHLDLYRTKDFDELKTVDLEQIWQKPETVTIIEWADKILDHLPPETIYYHLSRT